MLVSIFTYAANPNETKGTVCYISVFSGSYVLPSKKSKFR